MAIFVVTSTNRGAVKKLLTAAGLDSAEVRKLTLSQLQDKLNAYVSLGVITETNARAACELRGTTHDDDGDDSATTAVATTTDTQAVVQQTKAPTSIDEAVKNLVESLTPKAQALDVDAVQKIVRDMLHEVPHIKIDITAGDTVIKTLDGSKHWALADVLTIVTTVEQGRRLHAWLVGPSGSGKSHIGPQVAEALGLPFYSISALGSKYDAIGHGGINGDNALTLMTAVRKAFQHGGVLMLDDIDASNSNAFAALNELLANGRYGFPDGMIEQHKDFVCLASANTWGTGPTAEYVGRNKVDAATLTRFVRIEVPYDEKLERSLGAKHGSTGEKWALFVQGVRANVQRHGLKVLITPRHTLQGAALLARGMASDKVERYTVFAGLDKDTVAKIRPSLTYQEAA